MGRRHDQDGAVAIIVAVTLIALLGISAFAIDFGLAYTNKRQLQTSADAAAIAAAATYADDVGTCGTLAADATLRNEAEVEAATLMAENHPEAASVPADFQVQCTPAGGLQVTWTNEDASAVGFGGVFGVGEVNASRTAAAALGVPSTVESKLRPYMLCSVDFPDPAGPFPTQVRRIGFPGGVYPPGCPAPPGNWWTVNCPEMNANAESEMWPSIQEGCQYPVKIVDNPVPAPPDPAGLLAGCPPTPKPGNPDVADDCLDAGPGKITTQSSKQWTEVIDRKDDVVFPVFCGESHCSPAAIVTAGGDNAEYPVWAFVGARVCGYHLGNNKYWPPDPGGPCDKADPARNPVPYTETDGGATDNYFLVVFDRVQMSGSIAPSTCALGDSSCDGGLRQVFLVE